MIDTKCKEKVPLLCLVFEKHGGSKILVILEAKCKEKMSAVALTLNSTKPKPEDNQGFSHIVGLKSCRKGEGSALSTCEGIG